MCRVNVLKDRNRWRVRTIDRETGRVTARVYNTEQEAKSAARKIRREYRGPTGMELPKAIDAYELHLRAKGNRIRSIQVTVERLQTLLSDLGDVFTDDIEPEAATAAWRKFATTPGVRSGRPPAVDTQIGVLKQTQTFFRWCVSKGWAKVDPLEKVEVIGRRKKGKRQFVGVDESRRFLAKALELVKAGDTGALAAATALLMGMRASEIAERTVRELDDGGKILVITSAKTAAGVRRLLVPEVLRPLYAELTKGKRAEDRIFGSDANRHWVLRATARVCKAAGLPVVTSHGLRGTHATLAVAAGMTGDVVAKSLGHESFAVTAAHYARPDAVSGAQIDRVLGALN